MGEGNQCVEGNSACGLDLPSDSTDCSRQGWLGRDDRENSTADESHAGIESSNVEPALDAAATAVAGLVAVTVDYYSKQAELNKLLNASKTMTDDLEGAQSKLKDAIGKTRSAYDQALLRLAKMEKNSLSGARAIQAQKKQVEELKRQLEGLEGEYEAVVVLSVEQKRTNAYDASQGAAIDWTKVNEFRKKLQEEDKATAGTPKTDDISRSKPQVAGS